MVPLLGPPTTIQRTSYDDGTDPVVGACQWTDSDTWEPATRDGPETRSATGIPGGTTGGGDDGGGVGVEELGAGVDGLVDGWDTTGTVEP
jgi:hypothetical protein